MGHVQVREVLADGTSVLVAGLAHRLWDAPEQHQIVQTGAGLNVPATYEATYEATKQ